VGTTNKTRIDDYRQAVGPETGMLLKVHQSNFALVGFSEETGLKELAELARESGIVLVMDMGSGTFLQEVPGVLGDVPTVKGILSEDVDLVCFSGDKMLGGPQAGIIVGKRRWTRVLAKDPMARALRVGKLTLAALWTTLSCYRGGDRGARAVPVVDMFFAESDVLSGRADELLTRIKKHGLSGAKAEVVETQGQVGGGAMPLAELPGFGVALMPRNGDTEALAERLRTGDPPVLARRHQERVVLDVRTLIDRDELAHLAKAVSSALKKEVRRGG
jgi:L-seryl-tRNA(Ser) seleniumtransferase